MQREFAHLQRWTWQCVRLQGTSALHTANDALLLCSGCSSRLHSAAWGRSRPSKWWKGRVPVRWAASRVVSVPAWRSPSHRPTEESVRLFPTFPAPSIGYMQQILGESLCGHVPKFETSFWLLAKIEKMLWISFWTSVNTRNRNVCLDFWVCANCVKGRWVTGACPACNKGAAADAKHLSGADLLVLTFPDSQRILKSQLYYYVTYFFFMWMGDL